MYIPQPLDAPAVRLLALPRMKRHLCCAFLFFLLIIHVPPLHAESRVNWLTASEKDLRSILSEDCIGPVIDAARKFKTVAGPVKDKPFDLDYVIGLLAKDSLTDKAFVILDEAMRREKLLGDAFKQVSNTKCLEASPSLKLSVESDYNFLKCRFRLIVGISRAAVAKRMAQPSSRAYTSQAMESAIDALRDAASHGEKVKGYSNPLGANNPSVDKIRLLRSKLLEIWDQSQKQADVKPVAEMDLRSVVELLIVRDAVEQETVKR